VETTGYQINATWHKTFGVLVAGRVNWKSYQIFQQYGVVPVGLEIEEGLHTTDSIEPGPCLDHGPLVTFWQWTYSRLMKDPMNGPCSMCALAAKGWGSMEVALKAGGYFLYVPENHA